MAQIVFFYLLVSLYYWYLCISGIFVFLVSWYCWYLCITGIFELLISFTYLIYHFSQQQKKLSRVQYNYYFDICLPFYTVASLEPVTRTSYAFYLLDLPFSVKNLRSSRGMPQYNSNLPRTYGCHSTLSNY